ncbi:hypothetical protein CDIK_0345 [Cucumispora dikerogammari]|nr:hypothetical protein CDIK_0345 [Cucumispora dikerogammari]
MFISVIQFMTYVYSQANTETNKKEIVSNKYTLVSPSTSRIRSLDMFEIEAMLARRAILLSKFNKIKEAVVKIKQEHIKLKEEFSSEAEELINQNSYFSKLNLEAIFPKKKNSIDESLILSKNKKNLRELQLYLKKKIFKDDFLIPSNDEYDEFQRKVRMLFFRDFFFICHKFFLKKNYIISKVTAKNAPLNCHSMNAFLENIIEKDRLLIYGSYSNEKEIFSFEESEKQLSSSLTDLISILENKFFKKTNVSKKQLRTCLLENESFHFDDIPDILYRRLYSTIARFLKSNKHNKKTDYKKDIIETTRNIFDSWKLTEKKETSKCIDELVALKYREYLIITKTDLDKIGSVLPKDSNRVIYNAIIKELSKCCLHNESNLVTLYCKKVFHQELINKLKNIYVNDTEMYFLYGQSSLYDSIQQVSRRFERLKCEDNNRLSTYWSTL